MRQPNSEGISSETNSDEFWFFIKNIYLVLNKCFVDWLWKLNEQTKNGLNTGNTSPKGGVFLRFLLKVLHNSERINVADTVCAFKTWYVVCIRTCNVKKRMLLHLQSFLLPSNGIRLFLLKNWLTEWTLAVQQLIRYWLYLFFCIPVGLPQTFTVRHDSEFGYKQISQRIA